MSLKPVIDHVRVFTDTSNVHLENTAKKKKKMPYQTFSPFPTIFFSLSQINSKFELHFNFSPYVFQIKSKFCDLVKS